MINAPTQPGTLTHTPKRRGRPLSAPWPAVDWLLPDAEIARQRGVTREAVRRARIRYGVGPASPTPAARLRTYVATYRDALGDRTTSQVLTAAGVKVADATARLILREAGVRVAREPLPSPLDAADWRLPNLDLSRVWGVTSVAVARRRRVLAAIPAQWDLRDPATLRNPEYRKVLRREREKARRLGQRS